GGSRRRRRRSDGVDVHLAGEPVARSARGVGPVSRDLHVVLLGSVFRHDPRVAGPAAVIFDLDGVIVDSEGAWNDARRELTEQSGGNWRPDAQRAMMGMSSLEWSRYMHDELGVPMPPGEISDAVVERLEQHYEEQLPLIPGARE